MTTTQASIANRLHQLHHNGILVLPNAFDVASARQIEEAGATAIATTSAGVSWSWGSPDGEGMQLAPVLDLVRRIVAAVDVPVSVDIEGGYATDLDGLSETIRSVLNAGAVGINIEDAGPAGLRSIEEQAARLARIRSEAQTSGVELFINARTDTYLRGFGAPEDRLAETLRRAEAYVDAGASGIFVPGVSDPHTIETLAREIQAPLNILVGPGSPTVQQLADLGVARASSGSSIAEAVYGQVRRAAQELLKQGTYSGLGDGSEYSVLNALVTR
jgi:2-methylisocitrate lyase-like PEP mutase family enzyme